MINSKYTFKTSFLASCLVLLMTLPAMAQMTIDSFTPNPVLAGQPLTINGTGYNLSIFFDQMEYNRVYMDGVMVHQETFSNYSASQNTNHTSITFTVPTSISGNVDMYLVKYDAEANITYSESNHVTVAVENPNGPIADFTFTGNANDKSLYANNGSVVGATLTTDRFSKTGNAYSFNGTSNHIIVPASPNYNLSTSTDISVSGWFKSSTTNGILFDKSNGSSGWLGWLRSDGSLYFYLVQSGVGSASISSTTGWADGKWHHFVMQADRNLGMRIYIDGVSNIANNTVTTGINFNTVEDLLIGVAGNTGNTGLNTYFNGSLDDFKLYNRLLTASEVTSIYNTGGYPPPPTYCSTTVYTEPTGTVTDGSGTSSYNNNTNCDWTISGGAGTTIKLTFSAFSTETDFDYVQVYDGVDNTAPLLGFLSGFTIPAPITSSGPNLHITFKSNSAVVFPGWEANYQVIYDSLPVASYSLDGNANDQSAYGNNATVNGAVLGDDRFGNALSSYSLNGSSDYISVPTGAQFDFGTTTDFAVSGWFKTTKNSGYLFSKYDGINGFRAIMLFDGVVNFGVLQDGSGLGVSSSAGWNDGQWHHFVIQADRDTKLEIYLDGTSYFTQPNITTSKNPNSASELFFGTNDPAGTSNNFFQGGLDDFKIYNRLLSPTEILSQYNSGGWPPVVDPIQVDSLALVELFNTTGGANWTNSTGWLSGPLETWYGVSVANGRIDSLSLGGNNLTGTIPAKLGDMNQLVYLNLFNNKLTGSIPAALGSMTNLKAMYLSLNKLTGTIPTEFGNLSNMVLMSLSRNELSGAVPTQMTSLTNMAELYLYQNQFTSIPNFSAMTNLNVVAVRNNKLNFPNLITNYAKLETGSPSLLYQIVEDTITQVVTPGSLASISTTELTANTTYQWFFKGDSIAGATSNQYQFSFTSAKEGSYTVHMANPGALNWTLKRAPHQLSDGINAAPTALVMSDTTIKEAEAIGTIVGSFNTTDSDPNESFTYSLVTGTGDVDNFRFVIEGTNLKTNQVFNRSLNQSFSIRVRVTDGTGLTFDRNFSIAVIPLMVCTNEVFTTTTGSFEDGSGIFNYEPNFSCNWTIQAPVGSFVTLSFTEFDTELDYDFVRVYDGTSDLDPLIAQLSGNTLPTEISSVSNNMFVTFITDPLVNGAGFSADYAIVQPSLETDSAALVALYNITDGDNWTNNTNWLMGPVDTWFGVNVTNGRVDTLSLQNNNLVGTIPSQLGSLNQLTFLNLVANQLTGTIPAELGNLSQVRAMYIGANDLTGTVPVAFGNLTSIEYLSVSRCLLSGAVPAELTSLPNLIELYLYQNQFTSIPDFSAMTNLTVLQVRNNKLNFPDLITNYPKLLQFENPAFFQVVQDTISQVITPGEFVYLSTDELTANTTYQWMLNGEPIVGANSDFYEFNYSDATEGTYSVDMKNPGAPNWTVKRAPYFLSNGVDDAPTAISMNDTAVYDTRDIGTIVGSFNTTDKDPNETFTYSLVAGTGDVDNFRFLIDGADLKTNQVFDYALNQSFSILVRVTDGAGLTFDQNFTIAVIPSMVCNNDVFTATTGSFADGSGTFDYEPNFSCNWTIQGAPGSYIALNFSEFDTELDFDFVRIYDGTSNADVLLAELSGNTLPTEIVSSGNNMYITFDSDPLIQGAGFLANYEIFQSSAITAYYSFDGASAVDDSGNGYNGNDAFGGAPLYSADRYGYGASSFEPENNGTFIEINHGGNWDWNGDMTVAAWVRPNSLPQGTEFWDVIFAFGGNHGQMNIGGDGSLFYHWLGNGEANFTSVYTNSGAIKVREWNHVAIKMVGADIQLFVNGQAQQIALETQNIFNPSLAINRANIAVEPISTISSSSTGGDDNRWFDGSIDEVRIYASGTALDNQAITDLYNLERPDDLRVDLSMTNGDLASSNGYGYNIYYRDLNYQDLTSGIQYTSDRFGDPVGALDFQNTGNNGSVFHERSLNLRNNFTFNIWIKPYGYSEDDAGDVLINDGNSGRFMLGPNGELRYHYPANGGADYPFIDTRVDAIPLNQWSMVSWSIDANDELSIFVNGVRQDITTDGVNFNFTGSVANYTNFNRPVEFVIADADFGASNRYYNGAMDDIQFHQRLLSEGELLSLFESSDASILADFAFSGNAIDESPFANNGTPVGAILTEDRNRTPQSAYYFNGFDAFIETPALAKNTLDQLTILAWVRSDGFGSIQSIVEQRGGSDDFQFEINPDGGLYFSKWDDTGVESIIFTDVVLTDNNWHLVAATFDGTTATIYNDGAPVLSQAMGSNIRGVSSFALIGNSSDGSEPFFGDLDEITVLSYALSAQEIADIYADEAPAPRLAAYYPFTGNANDESTYNNNGTVNGAVLGADRFGSANEAYVFNAAQGQYISAPDAPQLSVGNNTDIVVSGWFNSTVNSGVLYDKSDGTTGYLSYLQTDGSINFTVVQSSAFADVNSSAGWNDGNWHHFVIQADRDLGMQIYLDGVLDVENTLNTTGINPDTPEDFLIGAAGGVNNAGLNTFFTGDLDEFRIFNYALDAFEVEEFYLSEAPFPPAAPTIVKAEQIGPNTIDVHWTDNADNETSYSVEVYESGFLAYFKDNLAADSQFARFAGLAQNVQYEFYVVASNNIGTGTSDPVVATAIPLATPIVDVSFPNFTLGDEITITYYPERSYPQGTLVGQTPIYFHSGLVTPGNEFGDWDGNTVVGNWGADDGVGLMTDNLDGSWSITLTPELYYGVTPDYNASQIGMVFRNADGSKAGYAALGNDIYLDLFNPDLITRPQGSYAVFDGTGEMFINELDAIDPNGWAVGNNFTSELWVNITELPNQDGEQHVLFSRNVVSYQAFSVELSNYNGVRYLDFKIYNDGLASYEFAFLEIDESYLNQWMHVAATYDGVTAKLYVNGLEQNATNITTNLPATLVPNEELESAVGYGGDSGFKGSLDDIRFWNYSRTSNEIRTDISTALDNSYPGLVGYWKLDEVYNDGVDDRTPDAIVSNDFYFFSTDGVPVFPDLEIEITSLSANLTAGGNGQANVTIYNTGDGDAAGNITNRLILSLDNVYGGRDDVELNVSELTIAIPAFSSINAVIDFTLPVSITTGPYYFGVRTDLYNEFEELTEFNNIFVTATPENVTGIVPLNTPVLNNPTNITSTEFRINWSSVSDATDYRYEVATDASFTNIVVNSTTTSGVLFADVAGLNLNTTYYYKVRAEAPGRLSDYAEGSVTTLDLGTPVLNAATNITPSSFSVSWAGVSNAASYNYILATDVGFVNIVTSSNTTGTSINFNGLNLNTTYYYAVASVGSTGSVGAYAVGEATTLDLGTPILNQPTNITSAGFSLSWSTVANAANYNYVLATDAGFINIVTDVTTPNTSADFTGLSRNTTYFYKVAAVSQSSALGNYAFGEVTTLDDSQNPQVIFTGIPDKLVPAALTITVSTNDNVGVSLVEFFKRPTEADPGTESKLTRSASTITGQQDFTFNLTNFDFDATGVSFYAIAYDQAGNSATTAVATIANNSVSEGTQNIPSIQIGNTVSSYQILAFPYQSTTVSNVLGGLPNDNSVWRMATWTGSSYNYGVSTLSPGVGYWLIMNDPSKTSLSFSSVDAISITSDVFTVNIRAGWNQIGNPYLRRINWQEVIDYNVANGNIGSGDLGALYVHNGGFGTASQLSPFRGGFVNSSITGTLDIPVSAITGARMVDEFAEPRAGIIDAGGWEVAMDIRSEQGLRYGISGFGQVKNAAMAYDNNDLKTPILFEEFIKAEFSDGSMNGISRSIHKLQDNDTWKFELSSSYQVGSSVDIQFNGNVPLSAGQRAIVVNLENGDIIDLQEQNTYKFKYQGSTFFKVIKGDASFVKSELLESNMLIGNIYPNPSSGKFMIPINGAQLLEGVEVSVEITDISGKTIYSFTKLLNNGESLLEVDLNGNHTDSGLYLIEIEMTEIISNTHKNITKKVYLKKI